MSDRYAVIGNPIAHSKSPAIHAAFARETGQRLTYDRLLGSPDAFEDEVRAFFAAGGRGLNVTVPFKERACALADERGASAGLAGAANTLLPLPDGRLRAENTDGVGLIRDLGVNLGLTLRGCRVLLLGAGGAARGVMGPLMDAGVAELVVANRTPDKAHALARMAREAGVSAWGPVRGCGLEELGAGPLAGFGLVINATSAGLSGAAPQLPASCIGPRGVAYDMLYGDAPTPFCRWAVGVGAARCHDGLGMLVEQAAESFRLWRGVRPGTQPVIEMLRRLK
jgi:shikimate dehydrogenase